MVRHAVILFEQSFLERTCFSNIRLLSRFGKDLNIPESHFKPKITSTSFSIDRTVVRELRE